MVLQMAFMRHSEVQSVLHEGTVVHVLTWELHVAHWL